MSTLALIGYGLLGGVALEALHWYMLARRPQEIAAFRRRPLYWITTAVMVLLGGVMPLLYNVQNALLAFQLGLTAPLALQKLATMLPEVAVRQGGPPKPGAAPTVSLRQFFSW